VLALCPGATDTEFFNSMGKDVSLKKHSPQQVVNIALSALDQNRHYVISGFRNTFESLVLPRLLPRSVIAKLVASISQQLFKPLT
jgi:uncharacterized protein